MIAPAGARLSSPSLCAQVAVTNPFARRHVYKAVIVNLDVISEANYRENVHVWEVP